MMGLEKSADKLNKYQHRLRAGKAKRIKANHVEKVVGKLEKREKELVAEIDDAEKPSKKERLTQKLSATRTLMSKAKWLLKEIA